MAELPSFSAMEARDDGRVRQLVESIRDYAIFMLDTQGRVLTWNAGAKAIKGYEASEIIGRSFTTFYTPEDIEAGKPAQILQRAEAEGSFEDEGWRVRKDGSRFWASVLVTAVRDVAGQLTAFAKVTRDLTDRRAMTNALSLQGAVLSTLGEGLLVVQERDGVIIHFNPAAERVLGFKPGGLQGLTLASLFPERSWNPDLLPEEVKRKLNQDGQGTFEALRVRADGSTFWARINVSRFVHPESGLLRVVTFHDISDRKKAEDDLRRAHDELEARVRERTAELTRANEALSQQILQRTEAERLAAVSEHRFKRLNESGIIGTFVSRADGAIVESNDAFLRMVGYTRDDLAAGLLSWRSLTPPEASGNLEGTSRHLVSDGFAGPWEKEYLRKDGGRVSVIIGMALLDDVTTHIAFVVDVSQRKAAEMSLRKTEEQLRQSQKMEAIGRLAGGISHDFNNLLSVILSYTEMLRRSLPAGDPISEDLAEIQTAAQRAAKLTKQLLLFSRQQTSAPRVLDLSEVLAGMDRMLQRVLGEDILLVSHAGADVGRVHIDRGYVEQVILNLVVNARDAMPTGGQLTIETANIDLDAGYAESHAGVLPGRYVMLAVSDTGCGMDAVTRERIFEPFFTTKKPGQGTGLGLSTVFGIVQQASGSIWVYSEPGRGTTFKVYLPRVDAEADLADPPAEPTSVSGSETILLVEDEASLRRIAATILRKSGYQVLEASNGGEALLLCEQTSGTIDLLLTDVVMPQLAGPELARRLLALRPAMKVLCMSGYADDSVVRHGLLDSTFPFIQKPVTVDALTAKVREVLDGPQVPG
jgi:PAS domain S-box-containing protein